MKILVVQESDWLLGNAVQQHYMLERLAAQGHEILVFDYPIRGPRWGWPTPRQRIAQVSKLGLGAGVTVRRPAMLRLPILGKLSWLAGSLAELVACFATWKPDVVVALGLSNCLPALWLAHCCGVPLLFHLIDALHTLPESRLLEPIAAACERRLLRNADQVVVINQALGEYAVAMGAKPERVQRVSTGCDLLRFGPHLDGAALRDAYGIAADETVLLFVGWLYRFSGLRELAHELAARPQLHGLRLLVVGQGDLLPELVQLRDQSLGGRLILAGQQPRAALPEFLAAADLCLLPAQANATMRQIVPAKIYEYLAAGRPVLATPLPGLLAEFGQESGLVYADGAAALLDAAVALAADPPRRQALGAAARRSAERTGSWDEVTAQFLCLLQQNTAVEPHARRPATPEWRGEAKLSHKLQRRSIHQQSQRLCAPDVSALPDTLEVVES